MKLSRSCFESLSTNECRGRHPLGESPFALSVAVTAAVEGLGGVFCILSGVLGRWGGFNDSKPDFVGVGIGGHFIAYKQSATMKAGGPSCVGWG